jgi:predicted MFS family arabinose efflux permease
MSDPVPAPDPIIIVHGTPTQPQIAAGLRQAVLVIGAIAGALGAKGAFVDGLNQFLTYVGPAAAAIAFVWGQYATWKHAKDAAKMATILPPNVAQTK